MKIARALRYERAVLHPLLARAYIMQQRYQDILTDIPGTAAREEEQVPNMAMRALAYLFMGDVRQAELTLAPALRLAPHDDNVLLARTRLLLARGELPQASASAAELLGHNPSNIEALMLEGDVLGRRGDAEGALASMNRAVGLAPYWVPARVQRANQFMSMGRNKEAQQDVDASFDVDWHDPGVQLANAVLMIRNGRYADAATEFQRIGPVMERFPKGYYYQALNASLQDQNESALEMAVRYLKLAPGDQEALRLAGSLESKLGRPERTVDYLSRATSAGLRDAEAFDLLGRAHFVLGRTAAAIENYRRATAMEPDNKDYAAHLAAAESLSGPAAVPAAAMGAAR